MILKRPAAWAGMFILVLALIFMRICPVRVNDPPDTHDAEVTLLGTLQDRQCKNNSYILLLADVSVVSHKSTEKNPIQKNEHYPGVQVWLSDASYSKLPEIGERTVVKGKAEAFSEARNPGEFDMRLYYHIRGVSFRLLQGKITGRAGHGNPVLEGIQVLKEKMLNALDKALPEEDAGVVKAMTLGDRTTLSAEAKGLYQRNGLAHILSISSLHMSILGYGIYRGLKKAHAGTFVSAVTALILTSIYAVMTGGGTTVLRALTMFAICLGADLCGRTYDMLTALSLSLIIVLITNPLMVYDTGFMLSFVAVLGISLVNPWLRNLLPRPKGFKCRIIDTVSVSLSIQTATLPVVLYFFYEIPLISIPLNLILLPFMGILVVSALLLAVSGAFGVSALFPFVFICRVILLIFRTGCEICDRIPFTHFIAGRPSIIRIIIYYLCLLIIISGGIEKLLKTKYKKMRRAVMPVVFVVLIMLMIIRPAGGITIMMLDIGQGDCILIKSPAGTTYLIDCGSTTEKEIARYRVIPAMKSMGLRKIDYCIMTHPDEDHISGFAEMFEIEASERIPIENFIMPVIKNPGKTYSELEKAAKNNRINVLKISKDQMFREGKMEIRCLHPYRGFTAEDVNEYSVTLELKYGEFKALFTGDIQGMGEKMVINELKNEGKISLLKVAHHGSKNSTPEELLQEIRPAVSMISAGKNNVYGHPHKETIERLEKIHTKIYTTIKSGAVTLKTDGNKMKIEPFIKENTYETE